MMEQEPGETSRTRRLPAQIAGWTFVGTGVGHGLVTLMPWPDSIRGILQEMERADFALGGISRSMEELMRGFSLAMMLLLIGFGTAVLLLVRQGGLPRDIAWLGLALSTALLAVAVLLLPTPPIVTMTVAASAFALSLRHETRQASQGSPAGS